MFSQTPDGTHRICKEPTSGKIPQGKSINEARAGKKYWHFSIIDGYFCVTVSTKPKP